MIEPSETRETPYQAEYATDFGIEQLKWPSGVHIQAINGGLRMGGPWCDQETAAEVWKAVQCFAETGSLVRKQETPLGMWERTEIGERITEEGGWVSVRTVHGKLGIGVKPCQYSYTREEAGHLAAVLQCFADTGSLIRKEPPQSSSQPQDTP
jgi:hypothetical protein